MFKGNFFESRSLLRSTRSKTFSSKSVLKILSWNVGVFKAGESSSGFVEAKYLIHLPLDMSLKNHLIRILCVGAQQSEIKGLCEQCISLCSGSQEKLKMFEPQQ